MPKSHDLLQRHLHRPRKPARLPNHQQQFHNKRLRLLRQLRKDARLCGIELWPWQLRNHTHESEFLRPADCWWEVLYGGKCDAGDRVGD